MASTSAVTAALIFNLVGLGSSSRGVNSMSSSGQESTSVLHSGQDPLHWVSHFEIHSGWYACPQGSDTTHTAGSSLPRQMWHSCALQSWASARGRLSTALTGAIFF